jgi:hypothetical protein
LKIKFINIKILHIIMRGKFGLVISLILLVLVSAALIEPYHESKEVLISIDGFNMTLSEAIENDYFIDKTKFPTSNGITNLRTAHKGENILVEVEGIESSLQNAIDTSALCSLTSHSYESDKLNPGHFATKIEVSVDGKEVSLQDAIDTGKFCSCIDGIQNQGEEEIDCGGPCVACGTCDDGIQNQDEMGVDCGGVCPACPSCTDGIQNQDETGIDCGGSCSACPTCTDGIQNQGETGVDTGGPCPPLAPKITFGGNTFTCARGMWRVIGSTNRWSCSEPPIVYDANNVIARVSQDMTTVNQWCALFGTTAPSRIYQGGTKTDYNGYYVYYSNGWKFASGPKHVTASVVCYG